MPLTPDDQVAAAELALGLAEGDERAMLLRRVLAEPAFAAAVTEWRELFAALLVAAPEVEPPRALLRRLDGVGADVRPWRWGTGVASLAAAGLALALLLRPEAVAPPARTMAPTTYAAAMTVTGAGKGRAFAAVFDPVAGQVRLPLGVDVPSGRVAQLWRIGADGVPHALGLLAGTRTVAVPLSAADRAALAAGATLAVSIEPPGGSPTALPSGPVVATGALARI